jgi:hypothetical protein
MSIAMRNIKAILSNIFGILKKSCFLIATIPKHILKSNEKSINIRETDKIKTPIFQKLTPVNDANLTIYKNALDFVFENNDIKNIAISGPYSSGKSSIIETYKNKHTDKYFLHISLAHFTEVQEEDPLEKSKINEAMLEGKILNQLLHQIDIKNIPQTNFKIKKRLSKCKLIKTVLLVMFSLILCFYLIFFEVWHKYFDKLPNGLIKNILNITINYELQLVSGAILFFLLCSIIYSFLKAQMTKNIVKKLNFQGNEFELFGEDTESYFDKYLNEVLYIFDNSNADAIVFEDMDRYNANQIFVKLREINTLINNRSKKTMRFFYLLRDDIFISKDRTKFFDFVIPLVPIIDSSNSYEKFISYFVDAQILDFFDQHFLQGLSLYIDDMRILKNIYNEFLVYYEKIHTIELDNNKLLAMMVYKNLFPRDFSNLQLSRGYVYTLFAQKNVFIANEIEKINEQIREIDEKIEVLTQENLTDLDELDTLYIKFPNGQNIQIGGLNYQGIKSHLEAVRAMKQNPSNIRFIINGTQQSFLINEQIKLLEQNSDYMNRKKLIEEKNDNKINELKSEKNKLRNIINIITDGKLNELINRNNIDIIFSTSNTNEIGDEINFNKIKSNDYFPLIKYLIRNGYIDETYSDYMTYFYANSISNEDKIFLRSITDENAKEYNYKLKNPEVVFSRLKPSDFSKEEILNFDLLTWLLNNKKNYHQIIEKIISQLAELKNIYFVAQYVGTRQQIGPFIMFIITYWPGVLKVFLNSSITDEMQKEQFVIDVMNTLSEKEIMKLNENNILTNYISNFPDYLLQKSLNARDVTNKLKCIMVKFVKFPDESINTDLFDAIYKNDIYQINIDNIYYILENVYKLNKDDDFKQKNYTLVLSKSEEPLNVYINRNFNHYIDIIINESGDMINDNENVAIALINNDDVDIDKKNAYIGKLHLIFEDITSINNVEYWDILIENDKIKCCEKNIFAYYFANEHGLNQIIIDFINRHKRAIKISKEEIDEQYGDGSFSRLFNDIVECNNLSNEIYKKILCESNRIYNKFSKEQMPIDKMLILVETGIIRMTNDNLVFIREKYPDILLSFIVMNINEYIELIESENVDIDEILSLIEQDINDDLKILILKNINVSISIKGKNYSNTVKAHIIENNFYYEDISYLLKIYDNTTDGMRNAIIQGIIKNVDLIVSNAVKIPYSVLIAIFGNTFFNKENEKKILAINIAELDKNQIKNCFEKIGLHDYLSVFENKRPKFVVDSVNESILKVLKNKSIIRKYELDKKNSQYYRVQPILYRRQSST